MKRSVRIVDTLSYSTFHEVFNSSIIYICSLIFDNIELRSSLSTQRTIKKLISQYNKSFDVHSIQYKSIYVIERDDRVGGLLKYLLSGWLNLWIYITTPSKYCLVYTNNNPLSLIWITLLNHLFRKDVVIFCHGELELLIQSPPIYKPSFLYKYIFKGLFKYGRIGRCVKMFVLGNSILKNLEGHLNIHNKRQFYSIEHPYFFANRIPRIKDIKNRVGTVGVMTYAKGLSTLLRLSKDVHLSVVGKVMSNINIQDYPNIHFHVKGQYFMPREEYEKAINDLDYILFLYPTNSYKLIASGAVFDALDLNKPIITLSNDYFRSILKYPIGYVVDSEAEILEIIKKLPELTEHYETFIDNIQRLKKIFTPEVVANEFKQQLRS